MRNSQNQFKMNKYIVLFGAVGIITMISCTQSQKDSKQQPVQQQNQAPQTIVESNTSAVPATSPELSTSNEPAVVATTATPPKLNPPHGQPFHRCDIAVGSPLDSAPATTVVNTGATPTLENATAMNNPQVTNPTAPTVSNVSSTPPKLNPPHGQPYHRCDIPVGSPLAAAPAKPAPTVISTGGAPTLENAARLNNPQVNNPTAPTIANVSGTPPKLNPPHGQPFHKCEIPVGSPLN